MNYKLELFAKVIKSIEGLEEGSEAVTITFEGGSYFKQWHDQDCCESVEINQVDNNPSKFIGAVAHELIEKVVDRDDMSKSDLPDYCDSITATFYTLKTSKGYLDWRWYGESNGYYSESVECVFTKK